MTLLGVRNGLLLSTPEFVIVFYLGRLMGTVVGVGVTIGCGVGLVVALR